MQFGIVDAKTNQVIAIVQFDRNRDMQPEQGIYMIDSQTAKVGDFYDKETGELTVS